MEFSACIEMIFAKEADNYPERIKLAREAGLNIVEFWGWFNKDIDAIELALKTENMQLSALIAEPMLDLTKPENLDDYMIGLQKSIKTAQRLGAKTLIAQAGNLDRNRSFNAQRQCLITTLIAAGKTLQDSGVKLALEPLNTRFDHPGYFLSSTIEALDIIDEVNSPNVGLLYDLYHSMVMDEHPATVIGQRIDRIIHIHIADHPGRNEVGSGNLDLATPLKWLFDHGYDGLVGLEFRPTGNSVDALTQTYNKLK